MKHRIDAVYGYYRGELAGHVERKEIDDSTFVRALEHWLKEFVSPLVRDVLKTSSFRHRVVWSRDRLAEGAGTPERGLVERIEALFAEGGEHLADLFRSDTVVADLSAKMKAGEVEGKASPAATVSGVRPDYSPGDTPPFLLSLHRPLSLRTDFLDFQDTSSGQFGEGPATSGDFMRLVHPDQWLFCDTTVRAIRVRIDSNLNLLRSCVGGMIESVGDVPGFDRDAADRVGTLTSEAEAAGRELNDAIDLVGERRLEEACVAVLKGFAALSGPRLGKTDPTAEAWIETHFGWLGYEADEIVRCWGPLQVLVQNRRLGTESLARLAYSLAELANLPADGVSRDDAVAGYRVVFVDSTGQLFFDGDEVDLHPKRLRRSESRVRLVQLLVRKSARGGAMSAADLDDGLDDAHTDSAISNQISRLKRLLPSELRRLIVARRQKVLTYRINLLPSQIKVL